MCCNFMGIDKFFKWAANKQGARMVSKVSMDAET